MWCGTEGVGVLCLVLIWRFARPCTDCTEADSDPLQPWHRLIKHNIKLFGIVLFYFAIFVFDLFRLIAEIQCADAWLACASGEVRAAHMADLVYPLARGIYLFVELIVCVKFNEVLTFFHAAAPRRTVRSRTARRTCAVRFRNATCRMRCERSL